MKAVIVTVTYGKKKYEMSFIPENGKVTKDAMKIAWPIFIEKLGL